MDLPLQLRFNDVDEYTSYVSKNEDELYKLIIYGIQNAIEQGEEEVTVHEVAFMDLRSTYSVYYEKEVWIHVLEKAINYFSQLSELSQAQSDILLDGMNLKRLLEK